MRAWIEVGIGVAFMMLGSSSELTFCAATSHSCLKLFFLILFVFSEFGDYTQGHVRFARRRRKRKEKKGKKEGSSARIGVLFARLAFVNLTCFT